MRSSNRNWQALESLEDDGGTRCVDIFVRPDGRFGFETFRKDPEDLGRWTMLGLYSAARFMTIGEARSAAALAVPWCAERMRRT